MSNKRAIPLFDCRLAVERGTDYLDEALPAWERLTMWLHLKGCRDCRVHLRNLRQTATMLGQQPPETLSPNRREELLAALKRHRP